MSSSSSSVTSDLHPGVVIERRYRVVRELGRGGMGAVYEAEQVKLSKRVALKVMQPGRSRRDDQGSSRKRFLREARAASAIKHRNVVAILDFGDLEDGSTYYVMELLEGRDLSSLREADGRMEWSRVRGLLRQVLCALGAAHERGIVHRDIKPANIMLLDERDEWGHEWIKVLDFGIAKLREADEQSQPLTGTSELLGTVAYMAPEVVRGKPTDGRADLYAVGIVAYQLVTGTVPFQGTNPFQVLLRHLNDPPLPPSSLVPDLPPAVDALILRALAKDPDERYPSAAAMIEALDAMDGAPQDAPKDVRAQARARVEAATVPMRIEVVAGAPVRPVRRRSAWRLPLALGLAAAGCVVWLAAGRIEARFDTDATDEGVAPVLTPADASEPTIAAAPRVEPAAVVEQVPGSVVNEPERPSDAAETDTGASSGEPEAVVTADAEESPVAARGEARSHASASGAGQCATYECQQRRAERQLQKTVRRRCHSLASGEAVVVTLTIGTDGKALMPRALPPHEHTALGECVVEAVARADFPRPAKLSRKELRLEP